MARLHAVGGELEGGPHHLAVGLVEALAAAAADELELLQGLQVETSQPVVARISSGV